MPIQIYKCEDCSYGHNHYVASSDAGPKECPKCGSTDYIKHWGKISINKTYANVQELNEAEIDPYVREVHAKIGKEVMDHSDETLSNIFGQKHIDDSLASSDGWSTEDLETVEKLTNK